MVRSWLVVFETIVFFAGMLASNAVFSNRALAQCRGGGGQGGSLGTAGTTGVASTAGLLGLGGTGVSTYQSPGSLAYGLMMSQLIAQQMAQQQAMLAMRQQQKAEQLAARKYRAEQSRSAVAASRARTRALLAAQSGLPAATSPPATLVAYNAVKR